MKLGPDQLPDLKPRVVAISERIGLKKVPDAYVLQAGGSLNALATKFLSSNFIVLFSDLLEACGDDQEAADFVIDFVIGHELGHLKAGHLRFQWFLILGRLIPFLGSAYSRACERTSFTKQKRRRERRTPKPPPNVRRFFLSGAAHPP